MNDQIITQIAKDLTLKKEQVKNTLKLLMDGATIPFIARYRKEVTGNLDEEQIRKINEYYLYQETLYKRKEDVIRLIDEKGLLTEELKEAILKCEKLVEVDDLYRPYKEKKKTKATEAIKNGLEPLAKIIMSQPMTGSLQSMVAKYINENVKTEEEALQGAKYIIAEWMSDNASYRKWIRKFTYFNSVLETKKKKDASDENKVYEMYYTYQEKVTSLKPHRILAINRAEEEKVITVSLEVEKERIHQYLEEKTIKQPSSFVVPIIKDAIQDSYKRLIAPSIEREIRSELTEKAEDQAIEVFKENLENLLLTPPMKEKNVLGFDPAFRTGCKLAVLDKTGTPQKIAVIYPHEPRNEKEKAQAILLALLQEYDIDIIAIGNGTASRESEAFVAETLKKCPKQVSYILISEAGASVYSASKLAISEFPELHVEERSAISIGRRLQDPLSELVKIDPKSIGVGQYQHDVTTKKLDESLDFVVQKVVNKVGVNLNTASPSILSYVSGLTKKQIDKIVDYRTTKGKFETREELQKKKILSEKVYEQAIGFMRILNGKNILDKTNIHPESYDVTRKLLEQLQIKETEIGTDKVKERLENVSKEQLQQQLNIDAYTLEDIIKSLKEPIIDPRDEYPTPVLRSDILELEDLKVGMKLQGTVRNVVDFGVFIDIGLHNDGLAHISKLTDHYIKHPSEVVSVGDIVDCYVDEIFPEKKRVGLSLLQK